MYLPPEPPKEATYDVSRDSELMLLTDKLHASQPYRTDSPYILTTYILTTSNADNRLRKSLFLNGSTKNCFFPVQRVRL
jgi:hypothetical protein